MRSFRTAANGIHEMVHQRWAVRLIQLEIIPQARWDATNGKGGTATVTSTKACLHSDPNFTGNDKQLNA